MIKLRLWLIRLIAGKNLGVALNCAIDGHVIFEPHQWWTALVRVHKDRADDVVMIARLVPPKMTPKLVVVNGEPVDSVSR